MSDKKPISIAYIFQSNGSEEKRFEFNFDAETMEYISPPSENLPEWTLLEHCKCKNCPLNSESVKHCPIAKNIAQVASHFSEDKSYKETLIKVITSERTYMKEGKLQTGLFSILGLMMPTSGCPHMAFLKPMARFHMPFSSAYETLIRSLSMHLLKQFCVFKKGEKFDFNLDRLEENYKKVNLVNQGIISRIRSMAKGDASQNAIVVLDGFASFLELEKSSNFSELEELITFKNSLD